MALDLRACAMLNSEQFRDGLSVGWCFSRVCVHVVGAGGPSMRFAYSKFAACKHYKFITSFQLLACRMHDLSLLVWSLRESLCHVSSSNNSMCFHQSQSAILYWQLMQGPLCQCPITPQNPLGHFANLNAPRDLSRRHRNSPLIFRTGPGKVPRELRRGKCSHT